MEFIVKKLEVRVEDGLRLGYPRAVAEARKRLEP
jgi:hypothetical protein